MSLVLAHARAETLQLARYPAYAIPTLLFPAALLLVFGKRLEDDPQRLVAGFTATAVLGVAFFQFGVGIAHTRASPWERYVRTLGVGPGARLAARVMSALAFALLSSSVVAVVGGTVLSARLEWWRYGALLAVLAIGGIPFALLGIALGYWLPPRSAVPVANLVYLPLAVMGALWGKPDDLSPSADLASQLFPSRSWIELLEPAVHGGSLPIRHAAALVGWSFVFGAAAWIGYRRDEGERFT